MHQSAADSLLNVCTDERLNNCEPSTGCHCSLGSSDVCAADHEIIGKS